MCVSEKISKLPSLIGDFGVVTTGGGDNIVILQQTAAYLLKVYGSLMQNGDAPDPSLSVGFLAHHGEIMATGPTISSRADLSPANLVHSFKYLTISCLSQLSEALTAEPLRKMDRKSALNEVLQVRERRLT